MAFWRGRLSLAGRKAPGLTHVIPLGVSCRVTHQVRVFFGTGIAYPFDWWISPVAGLTRYLVNPDPAQVYGEGCLEERFEDGLVVAIRSKHFGAEMFHEFPRIQVSSRGRRVSTVAPGWQEHAARAQEKHSARLQRLLALDDRSNRLLFVRHKFAADPAAVAPTQDIADLWAVLHSRWPSARVDLLLVNVPVQGRLPRGVRSVVIDDLPGPTPEEWQGDHQHWRTAFAGQDLRLGAEVAPREPLQWSHGPPD